MEGAYDEDGKGLSVQDLHEPQDIADFKIASDHYHRVKEDVKLMAEMGLKAYRFSIAWTRIIPNGDAEINEKGIQFYDSLINELLSYGIEPVAVSYTHLFYIL